MNALLKDPQATIYGIVTLLLLLTFLAMGAHHTINALRIKCEDFVKGRQNIEPTHNEKLQKALEHYREFPKEKLADLITDWSKQIGVLLERGARQDDPLLAMLRGNIECVSLALTNGVPFVEVQQAATHELERRLERKMRTEATNLIERYVDAMGARNGTGNLEKYNS